MVHPPLVIAENNSEGATASGNPSSTVHSSNDSDGLPPRPPPPTTTNNSIVMAFFQRPWTPERVAHCSSNLFIFVGCITALIFATRGVKDVTQEYITLTIFIVGGTLFGGGCLLALINVSWLARKPGVRISAVQIICNIVLALITSYLELLFWPYPSVAYTILFAAGLPMFVLINLPSCFVKQYTPGRSRGSGSGMHGDDGDGDTVCLEEDAMDDDATFNEEVVLKDSDITQQTTTMEDEEVDIMMSDIDIDGVVDIEAPASPAIAAVSVSSLADADEEASA